ncbi:MAG: hypothetical protein M4579_002276 [Chaenotheca gracillima]|nr:MAG: hypothetical protein M4579_002276 [Chaenotheca gracillima]
MKRETLPSSSLTPWSKLNDVTFNGVKIIYSEDKGFSVVVERSIPLESTVENERGPLMVVPFDLLLSAKAVEGHAKLDRDFGALFEAVGDLGKATLDAKMNRLEAEFDHIRDSTASIPWCQRLWWNEESDQQLALDDWILVDAWYRSRALSFPATGDAMVPCIDMMNHTPGEKTNAYFDRDSDENAIISLPKGKSFQAGDEVTISYGDAKSASETLFSYGFIDPNKEFTPNLILDIEIPEDDPLKKAKEAVATVGAAIRISYDGQATQSQSLYIWLACVNEEDGMEFQVLQTNDGQRELKAFFKGNDITEDTTKLFELMTTDPLCEVFRLRAATLAQARVQEQLQLLDESHGFVEQAAQGEGISDAARSSAFRLRTLETALLQQAERDLESKKTSAYQSEAVQRYLGLLAEEPAMDVVDPQTEPDDFS